MYSGIVGVFFFLELPSSPAGGWCLVKGSPDVLQYHLFNVKHRVKKELASNGFVLTNPTYFWKYNAGQGWHDSRFCVNPPHFSRLSLKAADGMAKFIPGFHGSKEAWLLVHSLRHRPQLLQPPLGASDCLAQKYDQTPRPRVREGAKNTLWKAQNTLRSPNEVALIIPVALPPY